jgi:hypothetical protein
MARTWPGTICHLQAVPYEDILYFPPVDANTQTITQSFRLKPGKSWHIVKLISGSSVFSEQNSVNAAGTIWDQLVKGSLFGQSVKNHLQVNNWTQYKWVLIAREVGSEMNYLVGTRFTGATISVSYDNSSTTITTLQFDFKAISRAKIYQGNLINPYEVGSFSPGSPIQFLVGDANTIPNLGTTYTNAAIVGKNLIVMVDGKFIRQSIDANSLYCSYNPTTGVITFSAPLFVGQLIQIFY